MIILSIETSCDETSIAVLQNRTVLSNVTITQVLEQKRFGGIVPNLAAKLHVTNIQKVLKEALLKSKKKKEEIDLVAYTAKPGLILCLQIGKIMAETIALYLNKEIISIDHLEGHIFSSLLDNSKAWSFPALALLISGGHTQLYLLNDYHSLELIGDTVDDTIGECLDKVSVLMGYDYPGGPIIEKLAERGKNTFPLTIPKNDKSLIFSFSGLKSEIGRLIKKEGNKIDHSNLACSVQDVLVKILKKKISNVFSIYSKVNSFIIGGGVIANKFIRSSLSFFLKEINKNLRLFIPNILYSTDNAAMIGVRAYFKLLKETDKKQN